MNKPIKPYVSYYRVSTHKQGMHGLGMEAQQAAVKQWATSNDALELATFVEVESGKKASRPQLQAAISYARRSRSMLVVAKLDRLARNVAFLSALMDSGLDLVAVDMPQANRLVLHILAAVAEEEARLISDRTKAALAAYKARGGLLGGQRANTPPLTNDARMKSLERRRAKAVEHYKEVKPIIIKLKSEGTTLKAIATHLNEQGWRTRKGKMWSATQVMRLTLL